MSKVRCRKCQEEAEETVVHALEGYTHLGCIGGAWQAIKVSGEKTLDGAAIPNEIAFRKGDSPGEYWVDVNPRNITCDVLHVRFNISELDGLAEKCEEELRKERAADRRAK